MEKSELLFGALVIAIVVILIFCRKICRTKDRSKEIMDNNYKSYFKETINELTEDEAILRINQEIKITKDIINSPWKPGELKEIAKSKKK